MDINVKIPNDVSALSVLSQNRVSDREEFRNDYYVYLDGKRLRKWFHGSVDEPYFWPPVLDQLARVEAAYQKAYIRSTKTWKALETLLIHIMANSPLATKEQLVQAGFREGDKQHYLTGAPCVIVHGPADNTGRVAVFAVHYSKINSDRGIPSYWKDWVEKPLKLFGTREGTELLRLEQRHRSRLRGRTYEMLTEALIKTAKKLPPPDSTIGFRNYCITVNGRQYWIGAHRNAYGGYFYQVKHFPEDDTVFHIVDAYGVKP